MSLDAMRWAMVQRPTKSVYKFVLVAMADRAGENHCCFPSIKRLSLDTMQDRKTVIAGLKCLVNLGLIRDTGKRKGRTGKVKVYQLVGVPDRHDQPVVMSGKKQPKPHPEANEPEGGSVRKEQPAQPASRAFAPSPKGNDALNGIITESADKTVVNQPLNGIIKPVKSSLMRNDPVDGMIPSDPPNDTMWGTLNDPLLGTQNLSVEPINEPISLQPTHTHPENQKKPETEKVEKLENLNPDSEPLHFAKPQKTKKAKALKSGIEKYRGIELKDLPDGLSPESARHFIDHRRTIKKPLTQHGFALYLKALLSCAECGLTLDQIVDETIDAGWQSIKPDWLNNRLKPSTRFSGYGDPMDDNRPRKELCA